MKLICVTLIFVNVFLIATASAQSPVDVRKARLKDLSFLLGTWQVSGDAKNWKGDTRTQSGTMKWSFDMDSTVIRNDREFNVLKATGDFDSGSKHYAFYEYIMFSPARSMFEFISFEYGAAGAPRYWLVDSKNKIYQYRFARFDTSRGVTLETVVTLKYINANKLVETFEDFVFETGERSYINTITLARVK